MRRVMLSAVLGLVPFATLAAAAEQERTEAVVAGPQFKAGYVHRVLWGDNYRDLWTTPVDLPVLDMQTFGGGLRVVRRVGHGQTKALALQGRDGRAYTFRPVLKDPIGLLPVELQDTVAARVARDQMSSQHPAGHVIAPGLLEAAGVLHNTPRLVVMPDDPALGDFRDDFKGLVGDIEEFTGQKGFAGAEEIVDGAEMWKRLDASPATRVDSRAYLTARLVDQLMGDWDRHRDQWRWAKLPGRAEWLPIPEDRDQAFARFEGAAVGLMRPALPLLVDFNGRYGSLDGLTFDGWDVDRRLLAGLERAAYLDAARELSARLTDAVIAAAVRRMPAPWFDKAGAETIKALAKRRDELPEQALRFYAYLAGEVDVRASQADDVVEIERLGGGDVTVRIAQTSDPETPYYERRFRHEETHDVRVYLLAGDDRVVTRGVRGGITVRVVGGAGEDVIDDSAVGGLRVSDSEGRTSVRRGPGTRVDASPYAAPPSNAHGDWIPARDWGRRTLFPILRLTGSTDYGVVLNLGLQSTGYGFRKDPYSDQQALKLSFSTKLRELRGEYDGRFHFENSKLEFGLKARASGYDVVHFYGLGNETGALLPQDRYRVNQDQFTLTPTLGFALGAHTKAYVGANLKHIVTEHGDETTIASFEPYGLTDTTELGAVAGFKLDTTDHAGLARSGVRLSVAGSAYPAVAGLDKGFGEIHGEAVGYFTAGATLALRAGGKQLFGTYPFYEAAYLGGAESLRGLAVQRYAGDAMVHGGAELYVPLAKAFVFVPGQIGVFGLTDVGRVYLDGEASQRWHTGVGGGVYFASPNRNNVVELSVARSEGRTGVYLRLGLALP